MQKKQIKICMSVYDEKEWVRNLKPLVKSLLKSTVHDFIDYSVQQGPVLEFNRNDSVIVTDDVRPELDLRFSHYLHFDVDCSPTLDQVYKMLSYDLDVVSGVYRMNGDNEHYSVQREDFSNYHESDLPNGLNEVARTALGCTSISAEVYNAMDFPYFEFGYSRNGDKVYEVSEDSYFCDKAKKLGFKVWADFDLKIKHHLRSFNKEFVL